LPKARSRADLPQAGDKKRMEKINLAAVIAAAAPCNGLAEIARLNDERIKVGRFQGRFAWHSHAREDEMFWVLRGRLTLQFRDGDVTLDAGEILIVPAGVEHRSVATEEADVVVIHPATTVLPRSPAE
jgi:mannose-6-phosphate isomerase-like protein (cupin superfamily)